MNKVITAFKRIRPANPMVLWQGFVICKHGLQQSWKQSYSASSTQTRSLLKQSGKQNQTNPDEAVTSSFRKGTMNDQ